MHKTLSFTNPLVLEKLKEIQQSKEITMSQYITNLILKDISPPPSSMSREEIISLIQSYCVSNPPQKTQTIDSNLIKDILDF